MQGMTISNIGNHVIKIFESCVKKTCLQTKFTIRQDKTKISAQSFFKSLTLSCLSKEVISLEQMCHLLKLDGVKVSKQGLHHRFNPQATSLMKALFEDCLKRFKTDQSPVIELLKTFSGVKILDSSTIGLPAGMKDLYKGCGGIGPESSLKIQTLFDYVKGHVDSITFTAGRENDQSYEGHLNNIEKSALYLQDLGYFKLDSFLKIHNQEAYFISRHFNQTAIFDEMGQKIDLAKALKSNVSFTKKVLIGKTSKIPVRMIAHRLSDAAVQRRIRNIKANAQRHGRTAQQETLNLARWSICITNIPVEMLQDKQVYLLYSLRWQVELFFKLCKQEAGVDKIKSKKSDRILCEIYARLICVFMLLYICYPVRWQQEREISFSKAYNCLRSRAIEFFEALKTSYRLKNFLKMFFSDLKDFAMKDIKRKRPATHQRLMAAQQWVSV